MRIEEKEASNLRVKKISKDAQCDRDSPFVYGNKTETPLQTFPMAIKWNPSVMVKPTCEYLGFTISVVVQCPPNNPLTVCIKDSSYVSINHMGWQPFVSV